MGETLCWLRSVVEFQQIVDGGCLIEGEFFENGETAVTKEGCGGSCYCEYGNVYCDSYRSKTSVAAAAAAVGSDSIDETDSTVSADCSTSTSENSDDQCKQKPQFENPEECGEETNGCCEAMISSCLACAAGMGEEEYCDQNPFTTGCTFGNLMSFARFSEEEQQCNTTNTTSDTESMLLQQLLDANAAIAELQAQIDNGGSTCSRRRGSRASGNRERAP